MLPVKLLAPPQCDPMHTASSAAPLARQSREEMMQQGAEKDEKEGGDALEKDDLKAKKK